MESVIMLPSASAIKGAIETLRNVGTRDAGLLRFLPAISLPLLLLRSIYR